MGTRDPRIDAYIAGSAEFAKPILRHLRDVVHRACPEVQEDVKWRSPSFSHHGLMCGMAAFKGHCTFGFWKGSLVVAGKRDAEAMGQFGRITSVKDLPGARVLGGYVKKAMRLNEAGVQPARRRSRSRPQASVPADLRRALERNRAAHETFAAFSPSKRRDYIEWLTEAKAAATRERRLATAVEWMAEGKSRNWKYEK